MASDEEKALTALDISAIIQVCAQNNVSKLKFGSLSVEFDRPTNPNHEEPKNTPILPAHLEQAAKMAILSDEAAVREEQLKKMQIEDPLRFEQLISDGDLEDGDIIDD